MATLKKYGLIVGIVLLIGFVAYVFWAGSQPRQMEATPVAEVQAETPTVELTPTTESTPTAQPTSTPTDTPTPLPSPTPMPTALPATILVTVSGEVNHPGDYWLTPIEGQDRYYVTQAIEAAGDFTDNADRDAITGAATLHHQDHIHVPAKGQAVDSIITNPNPTPTATTPASTDQATDQADNLYFWVVDKAQAPQIIADQANIHPIFAMVNTQKVLACVVKGSNVPEPTNVLGQIRKAGMATWNSSGNVRDFYVRGSYNGELQYQKVLATAASFGEVLNQMGVTLGDMQDQADRMFEVMAAIAENVDVYCSIWNRPTQAELTTEGGAEGDALRIRFQDVNGTFWFAIFEGVAMPAR
jgi:dsDNA-binding SOS-regulon protein